MNRSRLAFIGIVGAALLVVVAGVVLDQLNGQTSDSPDGTPGGTDRGPIDITVAASPLVSNWIETAVQSYNGQRRQVNGRVVEITLSTQDSLPVWNTPGIWTNINHPTAWIPEATFAVEYVNDVGLQFSVLTPSIASTVMMWGAPTDRAQVLISDYGVLNWNAIQQASVSTWAAIGGQPDWGMFFKPGFAQPDRYTSGMAALLVAAAEFQQQAVLDAATLSDPALVAWLKPVVESGPDFASLGAHPAETIAARGTSVADAAFLPESEWLASFSGLQHKLGALTLVYPSYQFWFNFPFAVWNGNDVTSQERSAAEDFMNFLLSDDQQRRASGVGLRRADGTPAATGLFDRAASAGVSINKPGGEVIEIPSRNDLRPFVNRNWTAF